MSRNLISRATERFIGAVIYNRAYSAKPGIPDSSTYVYEATPATADADGVSVSQSVTVATTPLATITGALASGGVATFDVPRNVVAAWTGTAVCTVTGTDLYGATVRQSSASGTSLTGTKAFKTITSVSLSADVTGLTVGSGDVLGLPFRCDANGVLAARAANAIDAGTFVPAVTTDPATATTGDVRGTFDPAVALNGSNKVSLLLKPAGDSTKLLAYGVDQF